jgi:hypothetical protein
LSSFSEDLFCDSLLIAQFESSSFSFKFEGFSFIFEFDSFLFFEFFNKFSFSSFTFEISLFSFDACETWETFLLNFSSSVFFLVGFFSGIVLQINLKI